MLPSTGPTETNLYFCELLKANLITIHLFASASDPDFLNKKKLATLIRSREGLGEDWGPGGEAAG